MEGKKLKLRPVLYLIASGAERNYFKTDLGQDLVGKHQATAIDLMLEAQKKGFQVVCTNKEEPFLEKARKEGVRTDKILFIGGGDLKLKISYADRRPDESVFYKRLHEMGIHPSLVVVGGHFREKCVPLGIDRVLSKDLTEGMKIPKVKYLIGTANIPSMGIDANNRFCNADSLDSITQKLSYLHGLGAEPITAQEFHAMNHQGRVKMRGYSTLKDIRGHYKDTLGEIKQSRVAQGLRGAKYREPERNEQMVRESNKRFQNIQGIFIHKVSIAGRQGKVARAPGRDALAEGLGAEDAAKLRTAVQAAGAIKGKIKRTYPYPYLSKKSGAAKR